jgi:membrane protease YdiL (CAAX protease family)
MAIPILSAIMMIIIAVIGAPIVYLSSRALKLTAEPPVIGNKRREAVLGLVAFVGVFVARFSTFVLTPIYQSIRLLYPTQQTILLNKPDALLVSINAVYFAILLVPVILAMKGTGQNIGSIDINLKNKGRMLALGFILSLVYLVVSVFVAPSVGGDFAGFSSSLVYGFILYTIVGFSEEVIFRGYIQTRLVAHSGTFTGLMGTSLLFALYHFPVTAFQFSGVALDGLISALLRFPMGLLFGYMMVKSQNIISPQ